MWWWAWCGARAVAVKLIAWVHDRLGVHGGVFHTVLDEITAEAVKYGKVPRILTSTANIKLLVRVRPHLERSTL